MRPPSDDQRTAPAAFESAKPNPLGILQWVYVGRVLVSTVVFVAAAFDYQAVPPEVLVVLAVAALASLAISGASGFYTHILQRQPGATFIYVQAFFDIALITTVVHVTGGAESDFIPLFILVIAVAAVLLPLASSLLVTILASSLFVTDIVVGYPEQLTVMVGLQIGVFVTVAIATGWLASRVRVVGQEREVLQKEVKRLRLQAGDILRKIGSGVVTVDGEGHLLFANPAAERLLSFSTADYLGRPVLAFLDARSHELAAAILATQREGRPIQRGEGRVVYQGRSCEIGMTTTVLEAGTEGPPSVTVIFTDISDQKRIEELNVRAQRLEAVAELSASLAHEIKNPLASIRSSVEQLAESMQASEDERFLGQLVIRESDRLSRLLNEFLEFSRVRVALSKPIDLRRLLHSAVEVVRQHPSCGQETDIRIVGECPQLEGDEDLLHRVVVNLVLNAVQAAGGKVNVTIDARRATPSDLPQGVSLESAVLLRISDDGPGIPVELRERVFEPFVTGRAGGSGLGLAVVQRAVQAHRGFVFVESAQHRGTTFTILLPTDGSREATA